MSRGRMGRVVWLAGVLAAGCGGGGGKSGGGPDPAPDPDPGPRLAGCAGELGYQVQAAAAGSPDEGPALLLDWLPPVARADGTALPAAELGGYHIYVGRQPGSFPLRLSVAAEEASYRLPAERGARYYLVVSALDHFGEESACSEEQAVAMP